MLKTFYILAWILVTLSALAALLGGYLNSLTIVAFSLAALALVYGLALWYVLTNTHDTRLEIFSRGDELSSKGGRK